VRSARRWFWWQACILLWGFTWRRRDVISHDHDRTRVRWLLQNASTDWRYACRSLWGARGTTVVAWSTLTLALGLSTAVFSVANSVLRRPLPFPEADRVVRIAEAMVDRSPYAASSAPVLPASGGRVSDTAIGQFLASATTLELVTPFATGTRVALTSAGAEQCSTAEVGVRFFELMGASARHGRLFVQADGESGAAPTVVISEMFWREALGAREDIAGTTLMLDEKPHVVAGVLSGTMRFPEEDIDVWLALNRRWPTPGVARNFSTSLDLIARLAPGTTVDSASAEARQLAYRIAAADPAFAEGFDVAAPEFRVRTLQDDLVHPVRPALLALMAGMALVLVIAGANLVNLLLARSTARHREMAVRLTLGAGRWRIVRPLLFEQLVIAGAGAASGAVLGWAVLRVVPAFAPDTLSRLMNVQFDLWSLGFTSVVALGLALLVGLLPAWQLPRTSLRDLTSASRAVAAGRVVSADRLRQGLVVLQVALAVVLLIGAGLLGRTLWALTGVHPGYVGRGAVIVQLGVADLLFRQPERQQSFFSELLSVLQRDPRVEAVGTTSTLPLFQVGLSGSIGIEGRPRPASPSEWPRANKVTVSAGYLDAVGTRIVRGRGLNAGDTASAEPVVVIDEALAAKYFPDQEPIGQRIDFMRTMWRIVGVAESIKQRDVTLAADPVTYFHVPQMPPVMAFNRLTGGLAVRTTGDPMEVVPAIRAALRQIDPTVPLHGAQRLDDRLSGTFAAPRFYGLTLGLFAALALVVSVLGVYGVLAYSVERRTVEFGVRRALGGDERHILGLVLRQATALVLMGACVGLLIAAAGTGLLRSLLFGVGALDATTFIVIAAALWLVGLLAALVPAWRAVRVDPALTLKAD
jgi:putative ABC transport system permease protein